MRRADLLPHFRVLRYDTRGHGASGVRPAITHDHLGRDVLALADARHERFAIAGVSLGGMIGLWLATHAPDRITAR